MSTSTEQEELVNLYKAHFESLSTNTTRIDTEKRKKQRAEAAARLRVRTSLLPPKPAAGRFKQLIGWSPARLPAADSFLGQECDRPAVGGSDR